MPTTAASILVGPTMAVMDRLRYRGKFATLCAMAHKLGMKVIAEGV